MKVTCIIPVRNGEDTIERAIKSALDAGCDKVLVYDDASTDNTLRIIHEYTLKHAGMVSFSHGGSVRTGVNFARNFLIELTDDDLIIPIDADDTLCDITPLRDTWQPGTWVYGNHIEKRQDSDDVLVKGAPAGSLARRNITGVTFLFSREDWLKVGGYDPDFAFAEDYGLQCNLTHNGVKPVYVNTTVYHRYLKPDGNERSILAGEYWSFYLQMARRKYKNVFTGM